VSARVVGSEPGTTGIVIVVAEITTYRVTIINVTRWSGCGYAA
jgi:hypothetical protein